MEDTSSQVDGGAKPPTPGAPPQPPGGHKPPVPAEGKKPPLPGSKTHHDAALHHAAAAHHHLEAARHLAEGEAVKAGEETDHALRHSGEAYKHTTKAVAQEHK